MFLLSWIFVSAAAFSAEQVKLVRSDGVIELEDGRAYSFADVIISPESIRMLPTLVLGRDVLVEPKKSKPGEVPFQRYQAEPAYLYVDTRELDLPFPLTATPQKNRVMVNQFLLAVGAARIDPRTTSPKAYKFDKIQEQAQLAGEGIWSYETIS